jgi:shikimate dehydrogenase
MKVYCIISDERAFQLKSPIIFSKVLKRQGIKGTYVPFMVKPKDLGAAIESLRILNLAGANVTVPYKEAVIPYLDILSEGANIIGAVNTIVCDEDRLKGYNTNAIGIMDALSNVDFQVDGKTALVLGSGGAAHAVVFILNWLRAGKIFVTARDPEKADSLVNRFSGQTIPLARLTKESLSADIVVNAMAVSSPEESPQMASIVDQIDISTCELVFDLNYGRRNNFWKNKADAIGVKFMDGLSPLAFQARRTFALWTGLQIPPEEFLKSLNDNE